MAERQELLIERWLPIDVIGAESMRERRCVQCAPAPVLSACLVGAAAADGESRRDPGERSARVESGLAR